MKHMFMAGALALTLFAQQEAKAQQPQAIPDAPKPQPALGPVTPGLGSTSSSSTAPTDSDEPAVGTSLPGSKPAQQDVDKDFAPDLPDAGQGPSRTFTLGLQANFVDVPFTVKDSKGNLVPGITWRDVRVYENGLRIHPAVFTVDPFPLSVALVIDQSLPYDTMTRVNNALNALPTAFSAYDNVSVWTYNNGPKLQTDFTAGQSPRLAAVIERSKATGREPMYYNAGEALSNGIRINGGAQDNITPLTAGGAGSPQGLSQQQVPREAHTLNDAILAAAITLSHVPQDRFRVIYIISDGKEFGSVAKTKDVIKYLQQNKIAVYGTLTGDSSVEGLGFLEHIHLPLTMHDNLLKAYTDATGGATYAEYRTHGIEVSFGKITEQVRSQYTVGYYSREPFIDGKYRKLEVKVLRPNLQVIAKQGYFPTAQVARPVTPVPAATTTQQ